MKRLESEDAAASQGGGEVGRGGSQGLGEGHLADPALPFAGPGHLVHKVGTRSHRSRAPHLVPVIFPKVLECSGAGGASEAPLSC